MNRLSMKIVSILFPSFAKELSTLDFLYKRATKRLRELESVDIKNKLLMKCIKSANEIVEREYVFLGIEKTKLDQLVLVYMMDLGDSIDIYVACPYSGHKMVQLFADLKANEKRMFIADIQCAEDDTSRGYGSVALNHLIRIAKTKRISRISGQISSTDWEHVDRLKYFYGKHGFRVILNEATKSGRILWDRLDSQEKKL